MALSFLNGLSRKKRAQMMVVDLGDRTTKAVLLERRGELLALTRFVLLDTPIYEKKISTARPRAAVERLSAGDRGRALARAQDAVAGNVFE